MRAPVRLGLLGAGRWGRTYIRALADLKEARIVRVASRNPDTRALVAPDCAVHADWREVVEAGDLDGIVIATPPALHVEMALAAIARGHPALVEKPVALSVESAERLCAEAAARRVLVMVDHVHLFHPAYQAMKGKAVAGGPVRAIVARAGARGPYRNDVGALWDWGPHDVAMCIDLLGGEPEAVDAECLERRSIESGRAERLRIRLRFAGNAQADIELSTLSDRHRSFDVRLDSGVLHYDGALPESPDDRPLARVVREFAAAIASKHAPLASISLGAAVVRTLARCEAAIERRALST